MMDPGITRKVLHEGCTLKLTEASLNVSAKTAANSVRRYRANGVDDLRDRFSRPRCSPWQTGPFAICSDWWMLPQCGICRRDVLSFAAQPEPELFRSTHLSISGRRVCIFVACVA
ncbi:MAG: leucine zipper domain-containing protein [Acidobacteriaceae bacterium]